MSKPTVTGKERRPYAANICFGCQNACGGCEWSEVDLDTGVIKFQPVLGWTATAIAYQTSSRGKELETYHVTACPKYKPMRRSPPQNRPGAPQRPVIAMGAHGEVLRFASVTEAERGTGARGTNIIAACKGRIKTSGGYRWEYAEDEE